MPKISTWLRVFRRQKLLAAVIRAATRGLRVQRSQKNAWHSQTDIGTKMGVIADFFARLLRMCPGRLFPGFLLIRQEVRAIFKTCNQLNLRGRRRQAETAA